MHNYGYTTCAIANTIHCTLGNVSHNEKVMLEIMKKAKKEGVKFLVFPELSLTGYTCQDLFFNTSLLERVSKSIQNLKTSMPSNMLVVFGAPITVNDTLFNCAVVMFNQHILGIVPKQYLPNQNEFYEKRWFSEPSDAFPKTITISEEKVPFGNIVFESNLGMKVGIEICEDLWSVIPPSSYLALAGANVIANLSASNELVGKDAYRKELIKTQSARTISAYLYTSSNFSESTSDVVFGGAGYVYENGKQIVQTEKYRTEKNLTFFDVDIEYLTNERRVNKTFTDSKKNLKNVDITTVSFSFSNLPINPFYSPLRKINPHPFVPDENDKDTYNSVCSEIIGIQSTALAQRLNAIHCHTVTIGISGGLDSTLALLVTVEAFKKLGLDLKDIITVTMPGFGTTGRTYENAKSLCTKLGTTLLDISIKDACMQHFKDIGHDPDVHDVTYENAQARERTQILMDIANKNGGFVVGTGDLSELMLGWCTYNGDHMSMYGVNCSIPKTLVRTLTKWYAVHKVESEELKEVLADILGTPISPELLPTDGNVVVQKTEEEVGPYEVNDFFIYHFFRNRFSREKILRMAKKAFEEKYSEEYLSSLYNSFIKRVMTNQFKRNCSPDGPMVGSVSASPRGFLRMPSDMPYQNW